MAAELTISRRAPAAARQMAEAAHRFLDSLVSQQRAAATFPFDGDERYRWDYRPGERNGLRLINMTPPQQERALALLDAGLSARGARQASEIIALETILREEERLQHRVNGCIRDPELYWFSVFGAPGGREPWAWRLSGHHLALHFTIVDGQQVASLPLFFGANPATVRHGPEAGLRTLPEEEDLARAFLRSLDEPLKRRAIVNPAAPSDILTDASRRADPSALPRGLPFADLDGEHRTRLVRLIRHYVDRVGPELAGNEWARIERAGLEAIAFAWAGGEERGQGHYYAVRGPTFMIEYDNTQNGANHIHSVWRDFTGDWGEDLLAAHYAQAHHR